MTQDESDTSPIHNAGSSKIPMTDNHYLLPLYKHRDAPSEKLSYYAGRKELDQFLEYYDKLCALYEVHSPGEKTKGLVGYCTRKLVELIKDIPAYTKGDYSKVVRELQYFMDGEDDCFSLTKVNRFTRKWRKRPIDSLEKFKRYHRHYLKLVGRAIGMETIDRNEYNRHFWEGLHQTLRQKIESRMLVNNPLLNVSTPFEMEKVTETALQLFNTRRFDQHLYDGSDSETDSEKEKYRPSRRRSTSDEDEDSESDEEDTPRKRTARRKHSSVPSKTAQKRDLPSTKKPEKDEVAKLTEQLSQLRLYLTRHDPNFQEDERPRRERSGRNSYQYNNQQSRNFSQYPRPFINNQLTSSQNSQQQVQSQAHFANASYNQ